MGRARHQSVQESGGLGGRELGERALQDRCGGPPAEPPHRDAHAVDASGPPEDAAVHARPLPAPPRLAPRAPRLRGDAAARRSAAAPPPPPAETATAAPAPPARLRRRARTRPCSRASSSSATPIGCRPASAPTASASSSSRRTRACSTSGSARPTIRRRPRWSPTSGRAPSAWRTWAETGKHVLYAQRQGRRRELPRLRRSTWRAGRRRTSRRSRACARDFHGTFDKQPDRRLRDDEPARQEAHGSGPRRPEDRQDRRAPGEHRRATTRYVVDHDAKLRLAHQAAAGRERGGLRPRQEEDEWTSVAQDPLRGRADDGARDLRPEPARPSTCATAAAATPARSSPSTWRAARPQVLFEDPKSDVQGNESQTGRGRTY